jgi:hypothetical protein
MSEKLTVTRTNNIGLKFKLTEESRYGTLVTLGNKAMLIKVSLEIFLASWYRWQMRGDKVQEAFSMLSADEREFLMSGITSQEWDEIFKDKEEN